MKRFRHSAPRAFGLAALLTLSATASLQAGTPAFVEHDLGISIVNGVLEDSDGFNMHSGGTVGDFNNDGWPDLFIVGGGGTTDTLLINDQQGGFNDESAAWGLTDLYRGNGATAADYDEDGWMDVFVTSYGDLPGATRPSQHRLYRNGGDGTFTNVAVAAGVNHTWERPDGMGAAFGDFDLDGDLDLFVGGWFPLVFGEGETFEGTRLFANRGDGTFVDVSVPAGILDSRTRGFGAVFADMDGDRYPELLIAGDFGTSKYYINNRNGTFSTGDVLAPGSDRVHNGMGNTVADINRDGKLDWFVTSIYPSWFCQGPWGNRLYINESNGLGDHRIRAVAEGAGVNNGGWGWGAASLDFDHDGWVDLVHTGGWWQCFDDHPDGTPPGCPNECFEGEQSYLFQNNGDETFAETSLDYGFDHTQQGRGLVHLDYDKDGDMDVAVFSNGEPMKLFQNTLSGDDIHWLKVYVDTSAVDEIAPNGYGTNVTVTTDGESQIYRFTGGSNYLGRSELVAHFGLADATTIDEVIVEWPNGFREVRTDVAPDQEIVITAEAPYTTTPMTRGEESTLTVTGLLEGEQVTYIASRVGPGSGPCRDEFGGLCLDLLSPTIIGSATADANGVATHTITVPLNAPDEAFTQAVVRRGEGGFASLKTPVVTTPISD